MLAPVLNCIILLKKGLHKARGTHNVGHVQDLLLMEGGYCWVGGHRYVHVRLASVVPPNASVASSGRSQHLDRHGGRISGPTPGAP